MIIHRIHIIPDFICKCCFQNYENECRAFKVFQSIKEKKHREKGGAQCVLIYMRERYEAQKKALIERHKTISRSKG